MMKINDSRETLGNSRALVVYEGRIWNIQSDLQIREDRDGEAAEGCGSYFAYGALHALRGFYVSTRDKVKMALQAAADRDPNVRRPFNILKAEAST